MLLVFARLGGGLLPDTKLFGKPTYVISKCQCLDVYRSVMLKRLNGFGTRSDYFS